MSEENDKINRTFQSHWVSKSCQVYKRIGEEIILIWSFQKSRNWKLFNFSISHFRGSKFSRHIFSLHFSFAIMKKSRNSRNLRVAKISCNKVINKILGRKAGRWQYKNTREKVFSQKRRKPTNLLDSIDISNCNNTNHSIDHKGRVKLENIQVAETLLRMKTFIVFPREKNCWGC